MGKYFFNKDNSYSEKLNDRVFLKEIGIKKKFLCKAASFLIKLPSSPQLESPLGVLRKVERGHWLTSSELYLHKIKYFPFLLLKDWLAHKTSVDLGLG